jgi:hypothetical protein
VFGCYNNLAIHTGRKKLLAQGTHHEVTMRARPGNHGDELWAPQGSRRDKESVGRVSGLRGGGGGGGPDGLMARRLVVAREVRWVEATTRGALRGGSFG